MSQSKIFNICNIYIFIWILYMFHWQNLGSLFPALDSISNLLLAINLAISIYYSFVFWNKYKQVPIFISINILLISMIIYGILSLIGFNLIDTFMHKEADINSGTYLISALRTFLPIYTFYIFTKKGYITEKYISNLVWIFLPLCIFIFFANKFVLISNETITGIKRGAILLVSIATLCFLYHQWKQVSLLNKVLLFSFIVLLIFVGITFVEDLADSSSVVQNKIEKTMEGNTSGRDEIVSNLLDVFFSSSVFNLFFGLGADATLFYGLQAHNDWVEILFNQGIIGFFLFSLFWFFVFVIWRYQVIKNSDMAFFLTLWLTCNFLRTFFSMWYSTANIMTTLPFGYFLANICFKRHKIINRDETVY